MKTGLTSSRLMRARLRSTRIRKYQQRRSGTIDEDAVPLQDLTGRLLRFASVGRIGVRSARAGL
jgi:hypothetical protein